MNKPAHEPAILQGTRRVRYLRLIAIFKIAKGVLASGSRRFAAFS